MPLARVQISVDKAEFVKKLSTRGNSQGLFLTYSDILTFAGAIGFRHKKRVPFDKFSRKDPDGVLQEQFKNSAVISLIALAETKDPNILVSTDEADLQRVKIFQEYANGGFEILQNELHGISSYLERTLLILYTERHKAMNELENFDITSIF
jgi:dnd system-associated protein 4